MFLQTNTKKQGDIGLGKAISYFTSQAITVSIPLTDSQDYDLVIEKNDILKKVQIKTTRYKNKAGNYTINLSIKGGNSKKNHIHKKGKDIKFDLLFVLTELGDTYLIPRSEIKESVTLGSKYEKYKV